MFAVELRTRNFSVNRFDLSKKAYLSTGKSDPFVTVKDGSEGREKYRTRTITNTLEPVWSETAVVAIPDVNGLLLLVRKSWFELDLVAFSELFNFDSTKTQNL